MMDNFWPGVGECPTSAQRILLELGNLQPMSFLECPKFAEDVFIQLEMARKSFFANSVLVSPQAAQPFFIIKKSLVLRLLEGPG